MHNETQQKRQWKSFAELAETEEFRQWSDDEFPHRETLLDLDRRDFLKLTAAGAALAGLSGCRILPNPKAVPFVRAPEGRVAGLSLHYATTLPIRGFATGVLVRSYEGRPVKIEGNPEHPASLGSSDVFTQAELLNLYDPDRSSQIFNRGEVSSWNQFMEALHPVLTSESSTGGAGIRLVTESVTSPVIGAQLAAFLKKYPNAKWHQWEPLSQNNVRQGTALVFGKSVAPVYNLKSAKTILSLDANFLTDMPGSVRYARDYAEGRRVRATSAEMNRLYVVESAYTITGASADHRVALKPSEIEAFARALYAKITGSGTVALPGGVEEKFLDALVADLTKTPGGSVVIPGDEQTPAVHALVHGINAQLGALGKTVQYVAPQESRVEDPTVSIKALADDLAAGSVKLLVVLGGNPVYNAPAELKLRELFLSEKCPLRVHLSQYEDETSAVCHWHLPESHPLESWGDGIAYDGTVSVQQPLISPLYNSKSVLELVALLGDQPVADGQLVRQHYAALKKDAWEKAVHDGVLTPGTPLAGLTAKGGLLAALPAATPVSGLEVSFRPDPTIWDGRYANNSWLQELPKPVTTIVWDNAAVVSPETAKKLGVIPSVTNVGSDAVNIAQYTGKKLIEIKVGAATIKVAAWILPGQPDDTITLYLGYGRTNAGNVGNEQGFNVYPLRTAATQSFVGGAQASATGESYDIAYTQPHHLMRSEIKNPLSAAVNVEESENRDIVVAATLTKFTETKGHLHHFHEVPVPRIGEEPEAEGEEHGEAKRGNHQGETWDADPLGRKHWQYAEKSLAKDDGFPSLYPNYSYKDYNAWAMSIDLTTCIGCNACTIACQAENNIPTVGKNQVARGREMHWIRIDHYYESTDFKDVESHFMPVPCMQCENAPCEPVCPVAATVHSHEGLNQMVYNRCVGTRYCSNNCPYKVRRFNFLKWTEGSALAKEGVRGTLDFYKTGTPLKMLSNPDVTVRGRGVMEKCTYCVQRINEARIEAKKEAREIQDGDVVTACQQACPTQAIIFGDLNNPNSKVSLLKAEPHDYGLLAELLTRPRTTYLAKIKNPNPELAPAVAAAAEGHA